MAPVTLYSIFKHSFPQRSLKWIWEYAHRVLFSVRLSCQSYQVAVNTPHMSTYHSHPSSPVSAHGNTWLQLACYLSDGLVNTHMRTSNNIHHHPTDVHTYTLGYVISWLCVSDVSLNTTANMQHWHFLYTQECTRLISLCFRIVLCILTLSLSNEYFHTNTHPSSSNTLHDNNRLYILCLLSCISSSSVYMTIIYYISYVFCHALVHVVSYMTITDYISYVVWLALVLLVSCMTIIDNIYLVYFLSCISSHVVFYQKSNMQMCLFYAIFKHEHY